MVCVCVQWCGRAYVPKLLCVCVCSFVCVSKNKRGLGFTMPTYMSIHPVYIPISIQPGIHISIYPFACSLLYLIIDLSIFPASHLSIYPSIRCLIIFLLSIYLYIHLSSQRHSSISPSIHGSTHLGTVYLSYLSIHLFIYSSKQVRPPLSQPSTNAASPGGESHMPKSTSRKQGSE